MNADSKPGILTRLGMPGVFLCAILVPGLGVAGCGGPAGDSPDEADPSVVPVRAPELPAVEGPRYRGANVVVVSVDTLRADHLSPYGADFPTPTAAGLAREGVVFERTVSPVPLTLPSHASMFTGLHPPEHGVRDNGGFFVEPELDTLAERLAAAGYDTAAFVGAYVLDSYWGLDQGFDTYGDRFRFDKLGTGGLNDVERTADVVVDRAVSWLDDRRPDDDPFFLWVHLYDPHDPYEPPDRFRGRAPTPYAGEVMFADEQAGRVVDALEETGLRRDTLVVYTSDHGESLGQHGEKTHSIFVYGATLGVPLIVAPPTAAEETGDPLLPAGLRVGRLARLVDLTPSVLDLLGVDDAGGTGETDGRSLLPLVAGSRTDPGDGDAADDLVGPVAYAESLYPRLHYGWSELFAVQTRRWKLIRAPRPELYDLVADPGEEENVYDRHPGIVAGLEAELERIVPESGGAAVPEPEELDPETAERLRSLGYLGGGSGDGAASGTGAAEGPRPDPKDQLPVLQKIRTASRLEGEGELESAEELLREVARQNPDNPDVHFALGSVYFKQGRFQKSIEENRRTLELRSDYPIAVLNLALAYRAAGRTEEAIAGFRRALELEPGNLKALINLAEVLYESGDLQQAARYYGEAIEAAPEYGPALVNYGNIALELERFEEARRALREAEALGAETRYLHFNLGLLAERRDDLDAALAQYRREVELHPEVFKAWVNLGILQRQRGEPEAALESFRQAADRAPQEVAGAYLAAETLAGMGRYGEALTWAREAAERAPGLAGVRRLLERLERIGEPGGGSIPGPDAG